MINCQIDIYTPNSPTQLPAVREKRKGKKINKDSKLSRSQSKDKSSLPGDCHLVYTQQPVPGRSEEAEGKLGFQPMEHTLRELY